MKEFINLVELHKTLEKDYIMCINYSDFRIERDLDLLTKVVVEYFKR